VTRCRYTEAIYQNYCYWLLAVLFCRRPEFQLINTLLLAIFVAEFLRFQATEELDIMAEVVRCNSQCFQSTLFAWSENTQLQYKTCVCVAGLVRERWIHTDMYA
jgi:hypothetical protein